MRTTTNKSVPASLFRSRDGSLICSHGDSTWAVPQEPVPGTGTENPRRAALPPRRTASPSFFGLRGGDAEHPPRARRGFCNGYKGASEHPEALLRGYKGCSARPAVLLRGYKGCSARPAMVPGGYKGSSAPSATLLRGYKAPSAHPAALLRGNRRLRAHPPDVLIGYKCPAARRAD